MFVGHYGVSFLAKDRDASIPLWVLFLAVQLLDLVWAPLVLAGIEKVRIVPGFTATNPLDLYYMPYTHSLVAAILWSAGAAIAYERFAHSTRRSGIVVGLAVFSHWLLDLLVHRPDLPLYGNALKVGFGLWNKPVLAFSLEAASLFGGMALLVRRHSYPRLSLIAFALCMLAIQAYIFFGPPPTSEQSLAFTALGSYALFAFLICLLVDRKLQPEPPMNRYVEPTEQLVTEIVVKDIRRSTAFYRQLGFSLLRDAGDFVELTWEDHQLFLAEASAFPEGDHGGLPTPPQFPLANIRVMVPNADEYWRRARDSGARIIFPIADRHYGLRDFTIADPDGFGVRFASILEAP